MSTSKEVFAKRKEGAIDEAYRMALELMGSPRADGWDRKAFCWCLIDLIKRDAKTEHQENLLHYRKQLESVEVDPADEVLSRGIAQRSVAVQSSRTADQSCESVKQGWPACGSGYDLSQGVGRRFS